MGIQKKMKGGGGGGMTFSILNLEIRLW